MSEKLPHVSLYLPFLSPGRGSTHPEAPCWSVSIATTQSARRASTSATRAPSSRRAFTPGNDLTRSPWPLTSVQPRHCYPDLHHGNENSTACPPSLFGPADKTWTLASHGRKTILTRTFVSPCGSDTGHHHRTLEMRPEKQTRYQHELQQNVGRRADDRVSHFCGGDGFHYWTSSFPQCGQREGCWRSKSVYWDTQRLHKCKQKSTNTHINTLDSYSQL